VPPGDEDALASAILRYLGHGDELRDSVLAFARERFSWDACARQAIELYESLLVGDPA
jgi:glycosyltransferase involved in cell wall biosynthesis